MSRNQEWYVEYKVIGFGDVTYRKGPYDFANALLERNDIEGYEGVYYCKVVKAGGADCGG